MPADFGPIGGTISLEDQVGVVLLPISYLRDVV